ncbi:MAG TPA: hypothetical protein VFQ72_03365 [Candidatus Paceibacterota bacterium]|nr:hypothetical protein [Candidatus Paceibacterota bacterium]
MLPQPTKHASAKASSLAVTCKDTPTHPVVKAVKTMLSRGGFGGEYNVFIQSQVHSGGGQAPMVRIINFTVSGVLVDVRHSTSNDSHFKCFLTSAGPEGLRPQRLYDELIAAFPTGTCLLDEEGSKVTPFPTKSAGANAPQPDQEAEASRSYFLEWTSDRTLMASTLEAFKIEKGGDWMSRDEARDVCRKLEPKANNRSIGQFLRSLTMHGMLDFDGESDRYRLKPSAPQIAHQAAQPPVQPAPAVPASLAAPTGSASLDIPSAEAIRERMLTLANKIAARDSLVEKGRALQTEEAEIDLQITTLKGQIDALLERKRQVKAEMTDINALCGNTEDHAKAVAQLKMLRDMFPVTVTG